jgi:hypothetical protein
MERKEKFRKMRIPKLEHNEKRSIPPEIIKQDHIKKVNPHIVPPVLQVNKSRPSSRPSSRPPSSQSRATSAGSRIKCTLLFPFLHFGTKVITFSYMVLMIVKGVWNDALGMRVARGQDVCIDSRGQR